MSGVRSDQSRPLDEPLVTGEYGSFTGNCKWFNNKIGYGFITVMDGEHKGKDIFVHHTGVCPKIPSSSSSLRIAHCSPDSLHSGWVQQALAQRPGVWYFDNARHCKSVLSSCITKTDTALWRKPRKWVCSFSTGCNVPSTHAGIKIFIGFALVLYPNRRGKLIDTKVKDIEILLLY